jgi:hypothetical protein
MADRHERGSNATDPRDPSRKPAKWLGAYIVIAFLVAIVGVYFAFGWGGNDGATQVEQVGS